MLTRWVKRPTPLSDGQPALSSIAIPAHPFPPPPMAQRELIHPSGPNDTHYRPLSAQVSTHRTSHTPSPIGWAASHVHPIL